MPKHDFFSPKAIANRIKSKGLQKLRWFCQVCQKQCRDENGFKCHTNSESHQRQMMIVARNPSKFMSAYSREFESAFLDELRRRHGTTRVRANVVYNEYISDKMHTHMNATQWTTLSGFVQYLGRTGKCVVDETEKGWYIQYINRDPKLLERQQNMAKKRKEDLDHDERNRRFINKQIRVAQKIKKERGEDEISDTDESKQMFVRDDSEKIQLSMKRKDPSGASKKKVGLNTSVFGETAIEDENLGSIDTGKKRKTDMDLLIKEEENRKAYMHEKEDKRDRKENWLAKHIIVKVMNKKLGDGKYYKKKGSVIDIEDKFIAHVEILDSDDVLSIDQDELETVIPSVDRRVLIVNGIGRGSVARLLSVNVETYSVRIRIETGSKTGRVLEKVEYEDVCKLDEEKYAKRKLRKD